MRFLGKLIFSLLVFSFLGFTTPQDCAVLKNNSFVYKLGGKDVLVEFGEEKHAEYHQKGKYYIKSNVEWFQTANTTSLFKT